MRSRPTPPARPLGRLEQAVMDHVWAHGPLTAEACRDGLRLAWPMKESTIRTVLRRLEHKGFVSHTTQGRTFIYRATAPAVTVAMRAVKHLIDRFCAGSAEALVVGMVDEAVLSPAQLERLARRIAQQKAKKP